MLSNLNTMSVEELIDKL
jgi:hypothetical protein